MKILNTEQLAKLPEGVLFSEYEPCKFGELKIKGETGYISDKGWASITGACVNEIEDNWNNNSLAAGDSSPLDTESCTRDVYHDKQLFAVWGIADLFKLAEIVDRALSVGEILPEAIAAVEFKL